MAGRQGWGRAHLASRRLKVPQKQTPRVRLWLNDEWIGGAAEVKQYGNRLGMEKFRQYFEMDKAGVKAEELKKFYLDLRSEFNDLP